MTSAGIGEVVVSWQQARSRSTSCRCFCLFSSAAAAIAVVSGSTSGSVVGQNKHMLVFAVASFALFFLCASLAGLLACRSHKLEHAPPRDNSGLGAGLKLSAPTAVWTTTCARVIRARAGALGTACLPAAIISM